MMLQVSPASYKILDLTRMKTCDTPGTQTIQIRGRLAVDVIGHTATNGRGDGETVA